MPFNNPVESEGTITRDIESWVFRPELLGCK